MRGDGLGEREGGVRGEEEGRERRCRANENSLLTRKRYKVKHEHLLGTLSCGAAMEERIIGTKKRGLPPLFSVLLFFYPLKVRSTFPLDRRTEPPHLPAQACSLFLPRCRRMRCRLLTGAPSHRTCRRRARLVSFGLGIVSACARPGHQVLRIAVCSPLERF